jgi:hypothetical protein
MGVVYETEQATNNREQQSLSETEQATNNREKQSLSETEQAKNNREKQSLSETKQATNNREQQSLSVYPNILGRMKNEIDRVYYLKSNHRICGFHGCDDEEYRLLGC